MEISGELMLLDRVFRASRSTFGSARSHVVHRPTRLLLGRMNHAARVDLASWRFWQPLTRLDTRLLQTVVTQVHA